MDGSLGQEYPVGRPYEEGLSPIGMANAVVRRWRLVLVLPLVLALSVGLWTLDQDRTYVASALFMPQAAESRGGGGAAALAQQFGVTLGTNKSGQSPQFFVELLNTRAVLRAAVESEYQLIAEDGIQRHVTLIEWFGVSGETAALPPWVRAINRLRGKISSSVNQTTGVIQLRVSASQPDLAEQVAERLLHILNEFNIEVAQEKARDEGRFISGLIAEAQAELLAAEGALEDFLRQNRTFQNSPELTFEHDRLQRQVAVRQEVYNSLLRSREQVRIDAVRDTPLLTVIDHPAGTAQPQGRATIRRTTLAFVLGLLIAVGIAVLGEAWRRGEADKSEYREFRTLVRQAWEEIRRPRRWLRSESE